MRSKNLLLNLTLVLVAAAASVNARATEPSLEVRLDPRKFGIEDGARFEIRIIEPAPGHPVVDLGTLENLEVASGPSTGTEFSWTNGAAARAATYTYIIRGKDIGPASIGPIKVKIGEVHLRAEAISAEIVPGSVVRNRPQGRRSPFSLNPFEDVFGRRQPAPRATKVALRHILDAGDVVVGQPVLAQLVLDTTTGGVDGFEWDAAPSYPGWWAQRVDPPEQITGEVVEVDGDRYNRFVVVRYSLVPLKPGKLSVPEVRARIGFRARSLFDQPQVVERATKEIIVDVAPRPREPEGFSGAVGRLQYTASLEPKSIDFGESAVLTIELKGNGNLPLVEAPVRWPVCGDCDSYPPEEDSRVTVDENGIHGSRTWQTTLVPQTWGDLMLEPVTLAVYDPAAGHFRSQTLGPFHLVVAPPPATPVPPVADVALPAELEAINSGADQLAKPSRKSSPPWLWILGALFFGLLVGGLVTLIAARRRKVSLPPRQNGQKPAERARELQVALERWWLDARTRTKGRPLENEMIQLRKELEAVRFAPGRADHTDTVMDLEDRVRRLMRRA